LIIKAQFVLTIHCLQDKNKQTSPSFIKLYTLQSVAFKYVNATRIINWYQSLMRPKRRWLPLRHCSWWTFANESFLCKPSCY